MSFNYNIGPCFCVKQLFPECNLLVLYWQHQHPDCMQIVSKLYEQSTKQLLDSAYIIFHKQTYGGLRVKKFPTRFPKFLFVNHNQHKHSLQIVIVSKFFGVMWPEIAIKSSPSPQKLPKTILNSLYIKSDVFKIAQKFYKTRATFAWKFITKKDLLKIAQS